MFSGVSGLKGSITKVGAEKIDVDNIRLKDRESYIWDSYIGKLQNTANDNLVKTEISQNIDENAIVEGMWEDSPNSSKNSKIDNVEKSQLESVENVREKKYNDVVTYRRVQGGIGNNASQKRISINEDKTISILNKNVNLSLSVDNGEHSNYFLKKRGNDAHIIEMDVPKWFDDFLQETAIPQINYKNNLQNQGGTAPKITDITTPGKSFELPAPWIEWLEEYVTNAREKD